ncbi:MAG TPA: ABC transporter permease, partial [Candidatus Acidoferrum sp.]
MKLPAYLRSLVSALFDRASADHEMDAEIRTHLANRADDLERAGLPRVDAERRARIEFGSQERFKEEIREARDGHFFDTLVQDVRFGLRMLRKNPGFTAVAVLTLALGIGANSSVFSVTNSVLLESLPYQHESRLVMIWEQNTHSGNDHNVVSPANFLYWQDNNTVFDQMAAFWDEEVTVTGNGDPRQIPAQVVSANLFSLLGVSPILGRSFSSDEGQRGRDHVALLGYGLWQREFGGDRGVLGKPLRLDGENYLIVGVMPRDVTLFAPKGSLTGKVAELWLPFAWREDHRKPHGRYLSAVARMKENVSLVQAQTQMDSLVQNFTKLYPDFETGWGVNLVPVHADMVSHIRSTLLVLVGAVGFVLLIACANIANLMLGQAVAREREVAVRTALGASRSRIVWQYLTESIVLSLLGGTLGLLAAQWTTSALLALAPKDLHVKAAHLDWRVLLFGIATCLLTGIVFGVAPAFAAAHTDPADALRNGGRSETGVHRGGLRNAFAVAEIALSLILLSAAGLLMKSFVRLSAVDPGFDTRDLLTLRISLPSSKYAKEAQFIEFFNALLQQVRIAPGIRAATISNSFPLSGMTPGTSFEIVGKPSPPPGQDRVTDVQKAGSDYFRTMGIRLLRGRSFADREESVASHVVVISESLARQFFQDEDPLGQKILIDIGDKPEPSQIIGIAADVKRDSLETNSRPMCYLPHAELPFSSMMLAVRADSDPLAKAPVIGAIVHQLDPELPLASVTTMDQILGGTVARQRFAALL